MVNSNSEKLRLFRVNLTIAIVLIFILIATLFFFMGHHYQYLDSSNVEHQRKISSFEKAKIDFKGDFDISEKQFIRNNWYSASPKYRHAIDELEVIQGKERISDYREQKCHNSDNDNSTDCYAQFSRRPNIISDNNEVFGFHNKIVYIHTENSKASSKEFLCHEMLHSMVYREDAFHPAVYELGEKEVCY